jgi:hypothetical protein
MAGTKVQVVLDAALLAQIDKMVADEQADYATRAWAVRVCVRRETARLWDCRALDAVAKGPAPSE